MLLTKIRHSLYLTMLRIMAPFMPDSRHIAFTGSGSSRQLCEHIARLGVKKVLVVTDKPLRDLGIADKAITGLLDAGVAMAWYDGVLPDPTYEQVDEGLAILKAEECDVMLAVGGGSAMDCAKIIAAAATSEIGRAHV